MPWLGVVRRTVRVISSDTYQPWNGGYSPPLLSIVNLFPEVTQAVRHASLEENFPGTVNACFGK